MPALQTVCQFHKFRDIMEVDVQYLCLRVCVSERHHLPSPLLSRSLRKQPDVNILPLQLT